jgi:hypothetical protein
MTRQRVGGLVAIAVLPITWCVAFGVLVGGDPMFAIEIGGAALTAIWAALVSGELLASRRLARVLATEACPAMLFGVPCTITPALGADAVVIGAIRPRIFVGTALVASLDAAELMAVIRHEDHHRRTHAPMRSAGLAAWLRLFGRLPIVHRVVANRMVDLEALADLDAIRRGSSPRSLARALLKGHQGLRPVSFSFAADRRVAHLLDRAAGIPSDVPAQLPLEWLPVALLAALAVACHLVV